METFISTGSSSRVTLLCLLSCLLFPVVRLEANSLRRSAIVEAVQGARSSVVNIHGKKTLRAGDSSFVASSDQPKQVNGMGTGVIIDDRGYIVTNYHVIAGVKRIQVTLASEADAAGKRIQGKSLVARLIAHDPKTDLAVIKIDAAESLPVIRFGTSRDLMTGETVVAIGNAYGYEHTVTTGIISALHRPVQVSDTQKYVDLIQTDASINPGNSGGPLLNIDGEMIGINVAVRVGAQGIGFAVPVDQTLEVVGKLLSRENSKRAGHGVVGETRATTAGSKFVVTSVASGSAGDQAGLEAGDVVLSVDGEPIERRLDFAKEVLGRKRGTQLALGVERAGEKLDLALRLGGPPSVDNRTNSRSWQMLGMRLDPVGDSDFQAHRNRYNGGLKIVDVRSNSLAAKNGIRSGDVLVGMHKWETVSLDNIAYILDSDAFQSSTPMRFYIVRGSETLIGYFN